MVFCIVFEWLEKLTFRAIVPLHKVGYSLLAPSFISRSKTVYPVITPK